MAETISEAETQFLKELEPVAASLLNRHLAASKEWFPHELIPYGRGHDYDPEHTWTEADTDLELDDSIRSALYVNLLTEDNLPYYYRDIDQTFGSDDAWGAWNRRWTAEEGRHSMAIYGYLMTTRAIDPVYLERGRMAQVSGGETPTPANARRGNIYVTLQELATRISHRNTGTALEKTDSVGKKLMDRVGNDENFHMLFYRDLSTAAIELDPSGFVEDVETEVTNFAMPGTGIPGFAKHAVRIALGGIYGKTEFLEKVVEPTLRHWKIWDLTGLTGKAEAARESLSAYLESLAISVSKEKEKREARQARQLAADPAQP